MVAEPTLEPSLAQEEDEEYDEGEESDDYELEVLCRSFLHRARGGVFLLTSRMTGRRRRKWRLSARGGGGGGGR